MMLPTDQSDWKHACKDVMIPFRKHHVADTKEKMSNKTETPDKQKTFVMIRCEYKIQFRDNDSILAEWSY